MVMKAKNLCHSFHWFALCSVLLLTPFVCSKKHGNAANDLLEIINNNRTAQKLPKLSATQALGALLCNMQKNARGTAAETIPYIASHQRMTSPKFLLPIVALNSRLFGTISGYILGCHQKYLQPPEAFSQVLAQYQKTLSLLRNRTITEVGVGIIGSHKHKGPYIWCVLFSNSQTNTTFVLEDLGKGIEQKRGCYSGTSLPCSAGHRNSGLITNIWILLMLIFSFEFFVNTADLLLL